MAVRELAAYRSSSVACPRATRCSSCSLCHEEQGKHRSFEDFRWPDSAGETAPMNKQWDTLCGGRIACSCTPPRGLRRARPRPLLVMHCPTQTFVGCRMRYREEYPPVVLQSACHGHESAVSAIALSAR